MIAGDAEPAEISSDALSVIDDALPENVRYRDEGCDLSPSCLNCRLPMCRYDFPAGTRRLRTLGRDQEIVRLRRRERLPIDALAGRFHVSRRTVFRILKRCDDVAGSKGAFDDRSHDSPTACPPGPGAAACLRGQPRLLPGRAVAGRPAQSP